MLEQFLAANKNPSINDDPFRGEIDLGDGKTLSYQYTAYVDLGIAAFMQARQSSAEKLSPADFLKFASKMNEASSLRFTLKDANSGLATCLNMLVDQDRVRRTTLTNYFAKAGRYNGHPTQEIDFEISGFGGYTFLDSVSVHEHSAYNNTSAKWKPRYDKTNPYLMNKEELPEYLDALKATAWVNMQKGEIVDFSALALPLGMKMASADQFAHHTRGEEWFWGVKGMEP